MFQGFAIFSHPPRAGRNGIAFLEQLVQLRFVGVFSTGGGATDRLLLGDSQRSKELVETGAGQPHRCVTHFGPGLLPFLSFMLPVADSPSNRNGPRLLPTRRIARKARPTLKVPLSRLQCSTGG